jgi:enoyl-CoA hydratase/carnithine racemase
MSTVTSRLLQVERSRTCIHVRLARPDHYNALDGALLTCLHAFLTKQVEPLPLILEGDPDFFSVGVDITEMAHVDATQAARYSHLGHEVVAALEHWPAVTTAFVSGYVLGAGLELVLGCDVIAGSATFRAGLPGLAWAMVPCLGGLRRLACRTSETFSADLFLTGDMVDAQQALKAGLIDRIVHHDLEVVAMAAEMGDFSPGAVQAIRSLRLEAQGPIDADLDSRMFARPFATGECQRRLRQLLDNG